MINIMAERQTLQHKNKEGVSLKTKMAYENSFTVTPVSEIGKMYQPSPALEREKTSAIEQLEKFRKALEKKEALALLKADIAKMEQKDLPVIDLLKEVKVMLEQLRKESGLNGKQKEEAVKKAVAFLAAISEQQSKEKTVDQTVSTEQSLEAHLTNNVPPPEVSATEESGEFEPVQEVHPGKSPEHSLYGEEYGWDNWTGENTTTLATGENKNPEVEVASQKGNRKEKNTHSTSDTAKTSKARKKTGGLQRLFSKVLGKAQRKVVSPKKRTAKPATKSSVTRKTQKSVIEKKTILPSPEFLKAFTECPDRQVSQTSRTNAQTTTTLRSTRSLKMG